LSDHKDVEIVGISIDPMLAPVESLVRLVGINYTVLFGKLQLLRDWKVRGFPTSVLIDKQGNIRKKYIGFRDKSVFISDIEGIVGEN